jgi:hypothetical protein
MALLQHKIMDLTHNSLTQIAQQLGPNWSACRKHDWPAIENRVSGGYFYFRPVTQKRQWAIGCELVREGSRPLKSVYVEGEEIHVPSSINVSANKTETQIGGDINRRLLSDYLRYLAATTRYQNVQVKAASEKLSFLDELTKAIGAPSLRSQAKEPGCAHLGQSDEIRFGIPTVRGKGYGHIDVSTGNSCSITLNSLDRETGLKVATFLSSVLPT